jgi:hypothetical protein
MPQPAAAFAVLLRKPVDAAWFPDQWYTKYPMGFTETVCGSLAPDAFPYTARGLWIVLFPMT